MVSSLSAAARMGCLAGDTVSAFPSQQQAEEGLLIHENCPEKENTKLSGSVWFLFKQLQLPLVMLPTGVYKGCGSAENSTLRWWGCGDANQSKWYLGLLWLMARDTFDVKWAGLHRTVR